MSTRQELKECQDAPLILTASAESFNATNDQNSSSPAVRSKSLSHWGSGCNSQKGASMSGHSVFILDVNGKPLTPCKPSKARKLLKGNQAKPVWNKFGLFGIQMLVETRKEMPTSALGIDFGTKFEGYSVVVGKENNLSVMWKLPDKKKLVKKLTERRQLRRARRWRTCRRRQCKSDNREKDGFIAPSQLMMIQSRLKAIREFFRCYPIDVVAVEDVRFNHRDNRWGKNFSTVEIGKKKLYDWIRKHAYLTFYLGVDTEALRKRYSYKKSSNKSSEIFNSHCSDALAIAIDLYAQNYIEPGQFIVIDDMYRPVRRQLHDTQPSEGGIRHPYSTGNFKGTRKGTMCNLGQICGGTDNRFYVRDWDNKRTGVAQSKIQWLSHRFKTNIQFLYWLKPVVSLDGVL
ncbi:MAG: RRXRR domain-containing protein [Thermoplasmata archaeon]|nr:RRXRR domain-containing protein [Thermoplasmata archaeon]MBE3141075.1 RRXRR domain-containing protein [Thermoplasmata archaeon]